MPSSLKILRFGIAALAIGTLVGGWLALYVDSHAVDTAAQQQVLDLVRGLRQLDSDWSTDVLRSHADLNPNYDALAQPLRPLQEGLDALQARVDATGEPALRESLASVRQAIGDKSARIDQFKAQNSLFKNSLRYIPTVHEEILARMRGARDAGLSAQASAQQQARRALAQLDGAAAGDDEHVAQALAAVRASMQGHAVRDVADVMNLEGTTSALVGETLRYSAVPDRDAADAIRAQMERLRAALASYPASAQEPVSNLLVHLDTLLRLRTQQAELLRRISAIPVGARLDDLAERFARRFDGELARQYLYQRLLLAYSAFALLLVLGAATFVAHRVLTEQRRLAVLVGQQTRALRDNEAQLVQAQRMAAVGEMVASVAHEVNTPLAAIKSSLQSAQDLMGEVAGHESASTQLIDLFLPPPGEDADARARRHQLVHEHYRRESRLRQALDEVDGVETVQQLIGDGLSSVEHISSVVRNMLGFSRLDRTRVAPVRLEQGNDSTLVIANHLLRDVAVTTEYGDTPPVACDLAQVNQIVLNLLKNAADAVPARGGEIRIRTSMPGPAEVRVDVVDNGCGIPADALARIWEPFFTTKGGERGTGLGLSTCRKIAEAHGGRLTVDTAVGRGTTFSLLLPVTPPRSLYETNAQSAGAGLVKA